MNRELPLSDSEFEELASRVAGAEGYARVVPELTLGLLHKLNNIMTSIYFTVEGCEVDLEPGHPALELLKTLTTSANEAQQLVRKTADVNLSLGATDPEYHDLNTLVTSEAELAKFLLPRGIPFGITPATSPLLVRISMADFRRILFALAGNAADAMQESPAVSLRCVAGTEIVWEDYFPAIPVALHPGAAFLFTDNGSGLDRGVGEEIFDPFYSTRPNRLGLGLHQALCTARNNGGAIAARRHGPGAEFVCVLPRVSET